SVQMQSWVVICGALLVLVGADECPDAGRCKEGQTCCNSPSNGYECCPRVLFCKYSFTKVRVKKLFEFPGLQQGVSCSDGKHCCPEGHQCSLDSHSCIIKEVVTTVLCNDGLSECPNGASCSETPEGNWGCCPIPKAVCCDDGEHCCPAETTCDLTTLTCVNASDSMPTTEKIPMAEEECDAHTSCPSETTCCFMASCKKWGCCPLPKAVCCADGSHCCPTGYQCEDSRVSCVKDGVVIPWYTKIPATTSSSSDPRSVQCDAVNKCPEHTSCCRLFTGEWGCCPLQNAVCCPDQKHCCPQGYTCDITSRSCQKVIMLQLETIPLIPVYLPEYHLQLAPLKHRDIQCDDRYKCKDSETCCRTSAMTWGCCPAPNAVCCSDMKHCCPADYSCTEGGACIQNTRPNWHNWNFLNNKKRALNL
uniref:Granulins-like n=1 Tax=Kryptolebias marmoratus TaxID=37003 RepID=A0A3Q3F960_KRYMA